MSFRFLLLFLLSWTFVSVSSSNAAIIWDENAFGTLSTDNLDPTDLSVPRPDIGLPGGPLPIGVSTVLGSIENARGFGNVDVFSIKVAPGTLLTEMRIDSNSGTDVFVLGMNNDNFFPFNPSTFTNTLTLTDLAQIIGVAQIGDQFVGSQGPNRQDLLGSTGIPGVIGTSSLIGSRVNGFKVFEGHAANQGFDFVGPLPGATMPNTYTIYMQQQDANTEYELEFTVVAAIPEPTSLALVGLFAAAVLARRRR